MCSVPAVKDAAAVQQTETANIVGEHDTILTGQEITFVQIRHDTMAAKVYVRISTHELLRRVVYLVAVQSQRASIDTTQGREDSL